MLCRAAQLQPLLTLMTATGRTLPISGMKTPSATVLSSFRKTASHRLKVVPRLKANLKLGHACFRRQRQLFFADRDDNVCAGWMSIAEADFVDASRSPALARALYIPGFSNLYNVIMKYKLLARTSDSSVKHHMKPL